VVLITILFIDSKASPEILRHSFNRQYCNQLIVYDKDELFEPTLFPENISAF